jgi:hypothetical protein
LAAELPEHRGARMSNEIENQRRRRRVGRPSPAMLVALLALFVATGGSAIAAGHYLITSTKQIKPSVLRKLRGNSGPHGPAGPIGPIGLTGAKGETGAQGTPGANLTAETTLPSGQSESGAFSAGGGFTKTGFGFIGAGITYVQPLASAIPDNHIVDVQGPPGETAPHCPGLGQADKGYLCLYDDVFNDVEPGYGYSSTEASGHKYLGTPSPGVVLYWEILAGEGEPYVGGEYTVTAP